MKRVLLILVGLLVLPAALVADNTKISPDLQNDTSTSQVQVIVQYAPGTQVTCGGLLGPVFCLTNDILSLGGQILSQLPIVNGVVALLDHNGIVSLSNQP